MAKGIRVENGAKLVDVNTKVQQGTKDLLDAIVVTQAQGIHSKREFIEKALELFEAAYPEDVEVARKYLQLIGKGLVIYE
jgi:hypothetical protein